MWRKTTLLALLLISLYSAWYFKKNIPLGVTRSKRLAGALFLLRKKMRAVEDHEKLKKTRRWWVRPVFADHDTNGAWATLIPMMRDTDPDLFYDFMRITPQAFDKLLALIQPLIQKFSWRKPIALGERLAITLRYLAPGDSQTSLSYLFRVSSQAISKIVAEVTSAIWNVLKRRVFRDLTEDLWLRSAAEFQVMWNIPHCLGAIDGKQAFPHCGSRYYGYKKRHCLTFMAVSNAKHQFLIVESGASGKRSDANIFYRSAFFSKLTHRKLNIPPPCPVSGLNNDLPFFFIGDNAYPLFENFAVPFKGNNLKDEEMVYNYRLSRARRIVENAFGVMCSMFRIFFRPIEGSPALVRSVIMCCLALHNFHLQDEESIPPSRRRYNPEKYADYVREDGKLIEGRWRNERPASERSLFRDLVSMVSKQADPRAAVKGVELREMLLRYFILKSVPWQWKKAHLIV
ncbi:Protein ALP1-like [Frankliniella fusca]|uniref:Protein ALP1-like n=1 Tax=Frankliniella fusca TaxID=407009 RepID=A0AAE1HY39_9NEOP|nr:Protein ALP1-like [Frankliniella fusca]